MSATALVIRSAAASATAVRPTVPGTAVAASRTAVALALVAVGLVLVPGLWFVLAWWAWSAGWHVLAVAPGLLGVLALLMVGGLGLRAAPAPTPTARDRRAAPTDATQTVSPVRA